MSSLLYNHQLVEDRSAPLAVMVHGKAGNMKLMSVFKNIFPLPCNLLFPQAPYEDPIGGYSWSFDRDEESFNSASALLGDCIGDFIDQYQLNPSRLIFCGFSQGGAVLSRLCWEQRYKVTELVMLASFFMVDFAKPITDQPNIFIGHGNQDEVVPFSLMTGALEELSANSFDVTLCLENVTHKIGRKTSKNLKLWLKTTLLP